MKYKSNNNIVYSCKYHVVFCPKYRRKVLNNGVDERLKELINNICQKLHVDLIEMKVMPDHVHLLLLKRCIFIILRKEQYLCLEKYL